MENKPNPLFFDNAKHQRAYEAFLKETIYQEEEEIDLSLTVETIVKKLKAYEEVGTFYDEKRFVLLIDMSKQLYYYYSKNVENILGYTAEDPFVSGLKLVFKKFHPSQPKLPVVTQEWLKEASAGQLSKIDRYYLCGMLLKHKDGTPYRFFTQVDTIKIKNHNFSSLCLFSLQAIDHLVKSKSYWARVLSSHSTLGFFSSKEKSKLHKDVFSERELEILRLLSSHDTKDIANQLGIALETVMKHKKNMMEKLDARNTTSLIQLSKMCQLI